MRRITYSANAPLGSVVQTPRGGEAIAVPALAFYRSLFDLRINVTAILTMLPAAPDMPDAERLVLEEELVAHYWDGLGGVLFPRRMQRLLVRLVHDDRSGEWFPRVAEAIDTIVRSETLEDATDNHAEVRLSWLRMGYQGLVAPLHGAAGEFIADYAYLQRAIIEDMREAEAHKEGGSRIPYLRRLEEEGGFVFERVFQDVLTMDRLASEVAPENRASATSYMNRRRATTEGGVFEALELNQPIG